MAEGVALAALAPALVTVWLFLAAIPAMADGGPHGSAPNSGASPLTADSCAGCHQAHTAQGSSLLSTTGDEALCLTCHGASVTGATTDVMTGIQYAPGTLGVRSGTALGALRGGGFDQARIDSGHPARWLGTNLLSSSDDQRAKVSVLAAPQDVTSAHLNLTENGLSAPGRAWGNGPDEGGLGATINLSCGSCHNPHGNGQYRVLNPIPGDGPTGPLVEATANANVTDAALPASGDARNYTVIQVKGTTAGASSYMLYASDVLDAQMATPTKPWPVGDYSATGGDYWHVRVPWNSTTAAADAPNGIPSALPGQPAFQAQMTAWCLTCHSRYVSASAEDAYPDSMFTYRHETAGNRACTTCHVAHGSNARMEGPFSATMPFPDGSAPSYSIGGSTGDSRLLKVDNRGTCQLCHDPTYTEPRNQYRGPTPTPGVP